jgi:hypothetical protein
VARKDEVGDSMKTKEKFPMPKYVCDGDAFIINDDGEEKLLVIRRDDPHESPRDWDNVGTMVCWHKRYNLGDKHNFSQPVDFIRELLQESRDTKDVIAFVKSGKAKDLRLEYNKSTREWELQEYYSGNWYVAESYNAPLDMEDEYLADNICELIDDSDAFQFVTKAHVILPLYLYDHSGITISTGAFPCPWDSGRVGYIYVSKEKVFEENLGWIDPKLRKSGDPKILNDSNNWEHPTEDNWGKIATYRLESEVETYDDYLTGDVFGYQVHELDEDGVSVDVVDSCWGYFSSNPERSGILDEFLNKIVREAEIEERHWTSTSIKVVA